MRRVLVLSAVITFMPLVASACGSEPGDALDTLPPIRTTSTTTTTTTTPDGRRIFYEVKPNDNLSEIARRYQVPREAIVQLNALADGGETLQIGQVLEIPNDIRLDETLPPLPSSSASSTEP